MADDKKQDLEMFNQLMAEEMMRCDQTVLMTAAQTLYDTYTAYKKVGFTPHQSFELCKALLLAVFNNSLSRK